MMAIMDISVAVIQVYASHKLLCCYWQMIVKKELLTLLEHVSSSQVLVEFKFLNLKFSVQYFLDHCLHFSPWPMYYLSFFDTSDYPFGTETCKKYSVTVIFSDIFHIKRHLKPERKNTWEIPSLKAYLTSIMIRKKRHQ